MKSANVLAALLQGLTAGALSGALVGLAEAIYLAAGGVPDLLLFPYSVVLYGLIGVPLGIGTSAAAYVLGRFLTVDEARVFGLAGAGAFSAMALVILRYVLNRDLYMEQGVPLTGMIGIVAFIAVVDAVWVFGLPVMLRGPLKGLLKVYGLGGWVGLAVVLGLAYLLVPFGDDPRSSWDHGKGVPEGMEDAPNVLFVMVDTLRADHVSAYGAMDIDTPVMDEIAEDGVLFEKAYANASWTRASGASLWTSRHPSGHNAYLKSARLPDEVVTWSEVLHDAGMTTGALINNINLTRSFNFDQGYDTFIYEAPDYHYGATESVFGLSMYKVVHKVSEKVFGGHKVVGSFYQPADVVLDDAKGFIQANADDRWALFVHLMEPHDPYFEHPHLEGKGTNHYNGVGFARAEVEHPDPSKADYLRQVYATEVEYMDDLLEPFVAWLKESGSYDDTMIVITADHGEEFYEHGGWWHGTTLYDEQIHVPLIVKLPGQDRAGTRVPWQVRNIDVAPTLAAAVGVEADASWEGVDLFRAEDWPEPEPVEQDGAEDLEGEEEPAAAEEDDEESAEDEPAGPEACWAQRSHPRDRVVVAEEDFEGNQLQAIRSRGVKLIEANEGNPRGLEPVELYDIAEDPGETTNLHGQGDQICASYVEDIESELSGALSTIVEAAKSGAAQGGAAELTEAERCSLCALGYLSGEACADC